MFKRFKNIKLTALIGHLVVTLAYPAVRSARAEGNRLLLFTNALTIISLLMIVVGIFYSFILHGDLDRARYTFSRGLTNGIVKPFDVYEKEVKKDREDAFNYPLWLGILYLIVSAVLAYCVL